ncbi:MAG: hypothetical protein EOL97_11915 [Spirochaetia bacterium]|nr:hypothetical protein [Spirochaetia bacterium]
MKYKKKATLLFILSSFIPLILLLLYFMGPYAKGQKEKISVLMEKTLWQKKHLINNEINSYQLSVSSMMTNPLFTEPLNEILKTGKKDSATEVNNLKNIFSEQTYLNKNIEGFIYIDDSEETYFSYNKSNIFDEKVYNFIKEKANNYRNIIDKANGSLTFISTATIKTQTDYDLPLIILGANFLDAQRSLNRGHIFILINEEKFSTFLNPIYDKNTIYTSTYLIDNDNNIICSKEKNLINKKYNISLINNDKNISDIAISLDKLNLNLLSVYNQKDLYGNNLLFIIIPLLITISALIFTLLIIKNYINKITDYVLQVNDSVTIDDNHLNFTVKEHTDLNQINQKFNLLKTQLNQLLKEQKEKNQQLIEKEEEKRIAEIKALEAQVNPHFIYNTLNTLNWIAIEENNYIVSDAISDLGEILRYSISHIHIMATLNDEIIWLKKYLNLQKLRYNNQFNYNIICEENLLNTKIYKLLFQPFIENSIVHGFKDITYKGKIIIDIFSEDESTLVISIEDNGKGYIQNPNKKSTGIDSSINRVKLYYKEKAVIKINSEINKGTKVIIKIPRIII